jgi:hypothetical protein
VRDILLRAKRLRQPIPLARRIFHEAVLDLQTCAGLSGVVSGQL